MKIEILLFDGFDDLDAFGPFEVLTGAGLDTRFVTVEPREHVTSAARRAGRAARRARRPRPGARPRRRLERPRRPGACARGPPRRHHGRAQARGTRPAAGSARCAPARCCSPRPGSSTGRPAITHHTAIEDLRGFGAEVVDGARFVDDGDIITAAGVTSGIDMALHLVEPGARRRRPPRRRPTRSSGHPESSARASTSGRSIGRTSTSPRPRRTSRVAELSRQPAAQVDREAAVLGRPGEHRPRRRTPAAAARRRA